MKYLNGTDVNRDEKLIQQYTLVSSLWRVHLGAVPLGASLQSLYRSWEDKGNVEGPGIANRTLGFLSHIKDKNKGN